MRIEMTPNGVGSAVHELMFVGMSLPDAVDKVAAKIRKADLLNSDLIPWIVRIAEQHVYQRNRPLASGNGDGGGQGPDGTYTDPARPARSLFRGNPNDFLFSVPGYGRKRFGDFTRQDMRKLYEFYGSYRKTYTQKERVAKAMWQAMVDQNVQRVEGLSGDWARKLIEGKDEEPKKMLSA